MSGGTLRSVYDLTNSDPTILVVMAMAAEAAPLKAALGVASLPVPTWAANLPARLSVATAAEGGSIVVAENGTDPTTGVDCIGSTAAALATHVGLGALAERGTTPDLILSLGTAGGWHRYGTEIGDVYMAWDRFVSHDRRVDLPGFDAFGVGNLAAADLRKLAPELGCRLGVVTTGDSLDQSSVDAERILASGAEVKDMEAAAVAWIAALHGIAVSALKSITDLVDSPVETAIQFRANFDHALSTLTSIAVDLLERLGAR